MKLHVGYSVFAMYCIVAAVVAGAAKADVRFQKVDATTLAIYDAPDLMTPIGQVQFGLIDAGTGTFLTPTSNDLSGHVAVEDMPGTGTSGVVDVFYDGAGPLPFQTYFRESLSFSFPNIPGATFQSYEFGFGNIGVAYVFDLGSHGAHRFYVDGARDPRQTDIGFVVPIVYSPGTPGATDFYLAPTIRRSFSGQLDASLPLFELTISGEQSVPEPSTLILGLGAIGVLRFSARRRPAMFKRELYLVSP
jgi:hypothetical protein